jgi:hypothetical protein
VKPARNALSRLTALAGRLGSTVRRREDPVPEGRNREPDEEMREKNRRLKSLRQRLTERNRELEMLRTELLRAQSVARNPGRSVAGTPVFFVVGQAKSGTSWLMKILDAHPEILCRGEGRLFGKDFIQKDFERGQQGKIQPSSLYRALHEAEYLEAWIERSVWTRGDDVEGHLANLTRLATDYFLTQRLARSGKKIVGDKTPLLTDTVLEEIAEIYPDARVIHVIRDGRDAAVSLVHHRWNHSKDQGGIYELKPEELARRRAYRENPERLIGSGGGIFPEGTLANLAAGWKARVGKAMQDGRTLLGANYAEVRYEDLLERAHEEVARLLGFLGADAGAEVVRECVEAASFENLSGGRERGEEDSSSFFRKGIAGDWRNVFTERDRQIFKEAAGDLLVELGYEDDHDW